MSDESVLGKNQMLEPIERFATLNLMDNIWVVFDIESSFEKDGEPHIGCWSGEAESSEQALALAKEAWGF